MGAWGPGLYSDDFAADLRPAVKTLLRLPLSGDEIVATLAELHPAAGHTDDEDHPTFWIVIADQLHRAGIESSASERAIELIRSGTAIALSAELGMEARDLRRRAGILDDVATRLAERPPARKRTVLKRPQPLLLQPGEVYAYPADSRGNSVNPYLSDADIETEFEPVCWGSFLVSAAGHEFGFLAWYGLSPSRAYTATRPDFAEAVDAIDPATAAVGPLTAVQLRRLRLELLGVIASFEPTAVERSQVVDRVANDIAVSNVLSAWAPVGSHPTSSRS